jgi:hypothetical protein
MYAQLLYGNREIFVLPSAVVPRAASGRPEAVPMMHGTKKSHSSIVPAKPANKAEQTAAESVEGNDGTKRNAELQSTVRTQVGRPCHRRKTAYVKL